MTKKEFVAQKVLGIISSNAVLRACNTCKQNAPHTCDKIDESVFKPTLYLCWCNICRTVEEIDYSTLQKTCICI